MHYKVGLRDPQTDKFNIPLWQQTVWTNDKGSFSIKLKSFNAYAFKENKLPNTGYKVVDREGILPLRQVQIDVWGQHPEYKDEKYRC